MTLTALLLAALLQSDSVYVTPALRDFLGRAALANRAPPSQLLGYTARLESELAFVLRDSLGREMVGQVEQLAARAEWGRDGRYDVHVVGYRAQTMGNPYSALTFTRMYSVPTLFGDRVALGMNDGVPLSKSDSVARQKRAARDSAAERPRFRAVHPLATDRARYYRFTGGDTVAIIRTASGREIRIVRVYTHPISDPGANFTGFRGELDFDADRHQLVRMRGRFESHTARRDPLVARATGAVAVAYVEFVNVEVGNQWLPSVQRSEFQSAMGLLGDTRPVYRLVTRFRDHSLRIGDAPRSDDTVALPPTRARLTFARGDTTSRFGDWSQGLGILSASVNANDFDDLAPDAWRPSGRPHLGLWPRRLEDVARFNRVEGLFTGMSATLRFRDAMPGLSARASAGWAWSERTPRGSASVSLTRGPWTNTLQAERALTPTNDFLASLESGLSIGPILGGDDYDYVDRYRGSWSGTRLLTHIDRGFIATELSYVRDRHAPATVVRPPVGGEPFRENRLVAEGDYARSVLQLELNPRVTGESLSPGFGARARYEAAVGDLDWHRLDLRLAARQLWRGLAFSARVDGGLVTTGDAVMAPQALYEIGGGLDLPGYEYKEFGGDRAAVGRALAAYYLPVLRSPRRIARLVLPGLSPGIGVGVQGGWAEVTSVAARAGLIAMGRDGITPASVPTGRVRSTLDVRFTVLSGAVGVGYARPLEQGGGWRPFFMWGAAY